VASPGKGTSSGDSLMVTGCQHATIGSIVRGHFARNGENHGRPTFKKDTQANGLDVMLYFWDERDGPALCGWWFGPKVGGDQVWAFHANRDLRPPSNGWMVPFNGPVDPTLTVKASVATPPATVSPRPAHQPPAYQQQHQQQQPAHGGGGQGQGYGGGGVHLQQWSPNKSGQQASGGGGQGGWGGGGGSQHQQQGSWGSQQHQGGWQQQQQQQQRQQQQQQEQQRRMEEARRQEDMRKRMEENKKKVEEANRKRKEEQEAEMRRKVEEQKKRLEEMKRQREEEERQKKEAQERRAVELKAMSEIRKAQQKVRVAKLDNFEEAKRELEEVLDREVAKLGEKQQQVQEECETVVAQVQKRVEAVKEMRRKEEEKKQEDERKKREAEERAGQLLEQLRELVETAEKSLDNLKEKAESFKADVDLSLQEVEAMSSGIKEAGAEAESMATNCSEFFREHHPAMKLAPNTKPLQDGADGKDKVDTRQLLAQLLQRIGNCKRDALATVEKALKIKVSLLTRASAKEEEQEIRALFKKYDKNSDNMLSRKEILAYAHGEFGFSLPEATLDGIWEHHTEYSAKHGDKGVPLSAFQLMKVAVGVAREMERDQTRRANRQASQRRLEELKAKTLERIKQAADAVSEADQAVSRAEDDVKPLSVKSKGMRVAEMKTCADEIGVIISKATAAVSTAQEKMDGLKQGIEEEFKSEILSYISNETKKHESKLGRMDGRIKRATNLMARFQDEVGKKRAGEVDKVRAAALRVARYAQQMRNLSDEDLFGLFDASGTGAISEKDFLAFFETADKVIRPLKTDETEEGDQDGEKEEKEGNDAEGNDDAETIELAAEDLSEVFATLCQDGEAFLSMETFKQVMPQYMYVVKQTALTDGLGIKTSKTTRRLDLDEIVKVIKGPMKESVTGVMRHCVQALKDDVVGWVSAVGNAGTVFLKEGGRQFKVIKETSLTEAFEIEGKEELKEPAAPKLKVGEVVEVQEWPKKEPNSGFLRLKVRRKSDGAVGWATSTGRQGAAFLKIM